MVRWHCYRMLLLSYPIMYYIVFGCGIYYNVFVCMAINISVQYKGGLLPDILLTQCYYYRGIRLNAKRFSRCSL